METIRSVNDVSIRLTGERWTHIVENHDEMAGMMNEVLDAIAEPDWITTGYRGALIAWRAIGHGRFLAAIYKELNMKDGFVITAFTTSKPKKEPKIWP